MVKFPNTKQVVVDFVEEDINDALTYNKLEVFNNKLLANIHLTYLQINIVYYITFTFFFVREMTKFRFKSKCLRQSIRLTVGKKGLTFLEIICQTLRRLAFSSYMNMIALNIHTNIWRRCLLTQNFAKANLLMLH